MIILTNCYYSTYSRTVVAPYEEWKGLVMWLDVTRQWYADKFPFLATGA